MVKAEATTATVKEETVATAVKLEPAGALPTFLDVYGEDCEADPRLVDLTEDDDATENETLSGSTTDLSRNGADATSDREKSSDVGASHRYESMETDAILNVEVKREPPDDSLAETTVGDQIKETSASLATPVKSEDGPLPHQLKDEAPDDDDQQTSAPDAEGEDVVSRLDPSLADKYRHLTDSSFKQEFLANLIGNQDRDWDKLR